MSHPFVKPENREFRKRVGTFVKKSLHRTASTNLVFVCGGNHDGCLRTQFVEHMQTAMPDYRAFMPESAQEDFASFEDPAPLNLSDFEELISDLSLCIVIFAESPGSFAEVGLFSALKNARKKTLVVLDAKYQGESSFLAFGPVATISSKSSLGAALHFDFKAPNMGLVSSRVISRAKVRKFFHAIGEKPFDDLNPMELMSLSWFFVGLMKSCTVDDVIYCFNSVYGGNAKRGAIVHVVSVLIGAKILGRDVAGHLTMNDDNIKLADAVRGAERELELIRIEASGLWRDGDVSSLFGEM